MYDCVTNQSDQLITFQYPIQSNAEQLYSNASECTNDSPIRRANC